MQGNFTKLEFLREFAEGMNHSDAVVPDARDNAANGLPYIPFTHAAIPTGFNLLGGKPMESAGQGTELFCCLVESSESNLYLASACCKKL